jgi:hypothetical protein
MMNLGVCAGGLWMGQYIKLRYLASEYRILFNSLQMMITIIGVRDKKTMRGCTDLHVQMGSASVRMN